MIPVDNELRNYMGKPSRNLGSTFTRYNYNLEGRTVFVNKHIMKYMTYNLQKSLDNKNLQPQNISFAYSDC